jgi:hypothetical protein
MYVNGGFGPEAGCDIQLPKFTAEPQNKRFGRSAEAPSTGSRRTAVDASSPLCAMSLDRVGG